MKHLLSILFICIILSISAYGQNAKTLVYENWTNGTWVNSSKYTHTYDSKGVVTNILIQTWDTISNSWKNSIQYNYTNSNGKTIELLIQSWNTSSNAWTNSTRITYTYTNLNKDSTITYANYTNGVWVNSTKYTHTYDSKGVITNILIQTWNSTSNSWIDQNLYNYTNNSNGKIELEMIESWNSSSNSWANSMMVTHTYTNSNQDSTITYSNYTNGAWVNSTKNTYVYDVSGFPTNIIIQTWNSTYSTWIDNVEYNYTNNAEGAVQQITIQLWKTTSNTWVNSSRVTYTYEDTTTTSISHQDFSKFKVYPNPSSDKVNITLGENTNAKATITDLQGRIISTNTFSGNETSINVSNLPPNVYFISVEHNGMKEINKFIKK